MKVKLLKKLRREFKVVELTDPSLDNKRVYRLIRNGKVVNRAWITAYNQEDYRVLILLVAYCLFVFRRLPNFTWYDYNDMKNRIEELKRERKLKTQRKTRDKLIAKAKPLWP